MGKPKPQESHIIVTFPFNGVFLRPPLIFRPGCVLEECDGMIRIKDGRTVIAYFGQGDWGSAYYSEMTLSDREKEEFGNEVKEYAA